MRASRRRRRVVGHACVSARRPSQHGVVTCEAHEGRAAHGAEGAVGGVGRVRRAAAARDEHALRHAEAAERQRAERGVRGRRAVVQHPARARVGGAVGGEEVPARGGRESGADARDEEEEEQRAWRGGGGLKGGAER